jgi:putative nucleotidyltransferase with HDIG domain
MFLVGREAASERRNAPPGPSMEQLRSRIKDSSDVILNDEQLAVLVKYDFDEDLEAAMIEPLESIMQAGVVDRRSQLNRYASTGILLRDQRAKEEVPVQDVAHIYDLISARAALAPEKLSSLAQYSAQGLKLNTKELKLASEILSSLVVPNVELNEAETEARKASARDSIAPVSASVVKGKPIVVAGETITPIKEALLREAATRRPIGQRAIEFAGTLVVVMLMMMVLWQYLVRYQRLHLRVRRHFLLQIACFAITLGLARLFFTLAAAMSNWSETPPFNSQLGYKYLAPLAVGAVLITILTDAHAAFVFSAILTVFVGVLSDNVYLAGYTLMSSAGAIYHLQNCRDRTALVRAGLWIGAVNAATVLALDLLGANEPRLWLVLFDTFCGFMSGLLAAMVASLLLPLFEWLFEITTSIKLLELSNLNLPLLRRLAERAPGTYHHSIMVGMLAEAAADSIGADGLFARVACYYHDIGKSVRPTYFVENQAYENRHDGLSPKMSSIILANHVKQGIELARKHKLPPRITAIIPQHHGTGLMKYFYYKARNQANGGNPDALEQEFRYPGPKPQTKEAAIIMIADSVEAASRTIQEPTPTKLRNMIDMIITRIQDDGQLDECDITIRELKLVADSFVKTLMGMHHHRIAYPGYDFNRTGTPAMLAQTGPAADVAAEVDGPAAIQIAPPPASPEAKEASGD